MISCPACLADNAEHRRFCRGCGQRIAAYCPGCGFSNALSDAYCGGCGAALAASVQASASRPSPSAPAPPPVQQGVGYSQADIADLLRGTGPASEPPPKQKKRKESEEISQDLLDRMFNADADS